LFWRVLWRIINARATVVAKKRGNRRNEGGWRFWNTRISVEVFGTAVRIGVVLGWNNNDTALVNDDQQFWKIVFWQDAGHLKLWRGGPWLKELGRLRKGLK
jgi:hypothetical protein